MKIYRKLLSELFFSFLYSFHPDYIKGYLRELKELEEEKKKYAEKEAQKIIELEKRKKEEEEKRVLEEKTETQKQNLEPGKENVPNKAPDKQNVKETESENSNKENDDIEDEELEDEEEQLNLVVNEEDDDNVEFFI